MADIRCNVIPEPEENTRVVFGVQQKIPTLSGGGSDSYSCGNCNFVLAKDVNLEAIRQRMHTEGELGIVVKCPDCESFNELGPDLG